jgi:hypothetical protein
VQPVKHATNGGLDNGKVVYITGSSGDNKTVLYARANDEATSANTLGLMTETVTGGNKGFCTTFGLVRNINTSNLTEGGAVWLSKDTAGAMTAVRPEAPNNGVFIGFCVRKHASTGVIFVNVQNGYELEELHNVYAPSPTNGQVLTYVSGNSRWEAATVADQSATNELQTLSVATNTATLSNSGGSVTIAGGGINTVGTVGSTITVTGTEVDGSVTNEIQTIDQFSLSGQTLSASLSSDGVAPSTVTLPVVGITAGTNVTVSSTGGNFTINASGGGGAGNPAGSNGQIQFNSSNVFGASSNLFWDNTNGKLSVRSLTSPYGILDVQQTEDVPQIGTTELSSNYSGSNWTGSGYTWTHTTGFTDNLTATVSNLVTFPYGAYKLNLTISGRTAGSISITLKGGGDYSGITSTGVYYFNYLTTAGLVVTPTSDFNGTVTFNIVRVTASVPSFVTRGSNGSIAYEQRCDEGNMFMGLNAGRYSLNTSKSNFAFGGNAAASNITGTGWAAVGNGAGASNRTGSYWMAYGVSSGSLNTIGSFWTAQGFNTGRNNISGSGWLAQGANAGFSNLTGSNWIAIGAECTRYAVGGGNAQYFQNGVYIGNNVAATNGTVSSLTTNETVIGYNASGLGSNSTVIGNSSNTRTHFFGNTTIGGTTAAAFTPLARLHVLASGQSSGTDAFLVQNTNPANLFEVENNGKITYWATNTATGTTSVQTINRPSGTINIAAGETSKDVNNSLCTTSSIILPVIRTNDATATIKNVVPGNGLFTINLTAAATAETSVGFFIIN